VRNAHFEAREWGEEVIFLRRLSPGGATRSYGIQVARLAGLPQAVIARAREVLRQLEGADAVEGSLDPAAGAAPQLGLFSGSAPDREAAAPEEAAALAALRELEPDRLSPIDALTTLHRIVSRLRGEGTE
jgi:DNA mismatch repair protein MutS